MTKRSRQINLYRHPDGFALEIDDVKEDGLHFLMVMSEADFLALAARVGKLAAEIPTKPGEKK